MATPTLPAATAQAPELSIWIALDHFVQFTGSAAQLRDEGLIPDGFEWPQRRVVRRWDANGFAHSLERCRPAGHKGPMSSWLALDSWRLRVRVAHHDYRWFARRQLQRRREEYEAEYLSLTPEGQRKIRELVCRSAEAISDGRFQAFMKTVLPARRGRRV